MHNTSESIHNIRINKRKKNLQNSENNCKHLSVLSKASGVCSEYGFKKSRKKVQPWEILQDSWRNSSSKVNKMDMEQGSQHKRSENV